MKDHIIICGLGNIGFRIFELLKQAKQEMVVISDKVHEDLRWKVEESGSVFILGDARNEKFLLQAGIHHAKAILAVTDQDMANTNIMLNARNFNPHIKIIARMHDANLGSHISKPFGIHQIFSPSEIAAPIFARSIIDRSILAQFSLDRETFIVTNQNKIANEFKVDSLPNSFPDPLQVNTIKKHKSKVTILSRFLRKIRFLLSPAFANLRLLILVLACIILTSALILTWTMPLTYVEALYFVMTTVTTVGYGDINFLHSPPALKIFGCLLMISGAAAIALFFSSIIEIMLSKKLPSVVGGFPIPRKDHVVVVGAGHIGHHIVSTLLEHHVPTVIVENDTKNRYSADINRQVALVEGYLSSHETLELARIRTAKAILVITNNDIENLSISLAAKKINPNIINIIRIFSSRLSNQLQSTLSLDRVLSIANLSAPYFVAAVFGEEILMALKWEGKLIYLSRGSNKKLTQGEEYLTLGQKTYQNIRLCSINLNKPLP